MKDGKNSVSLNLNLLNEKTSFEKLEENLKASIFGVLYVLLKNQSFSIWVEIIFVIIQLLQFMAFPFRPLVNTISYNINFSSTTFGSKKARTGRFPTSCSTSRS